MTTDWFTASPTPFAPGGGLRPAVGGDDSGGQAEQERLDLADEDVRDLGDRGEAGDVRARRPALDDHVEEVAAGDADDGGEPVQHDGGGRHRQHPRHDEALDRRDAQDLHRGDLLADRAGPEVGADGAAARAGDQQRGDDRRGLLDDREHRPGAGLRLGTELAGELTEQQGDRRAERDREQRRRQRRHLRHEPRLLDVLAQLERGPDGLLEDVDAEAEQLADRGEGPGDRARRGHASRPLPQKRSRRLPPLSESSSDPSFACGSPL